MIDDFVTAKALLDKAQAFADLKGLRLCIQGAAFTPVTTETYLKETFLSNDTDPLGLAADSSDRQDSIYQLDIYTPKDDGKFAGLAVGNEIKAEFPRVSFVLNNASQKVQISNVSSRIMPANKTHNLTMINIELIVIASSA